jgi:hypothetical protein
MKKPLQQREKKITDVGQQNFTISEVFTNVMSYLRSRDEPGKSGALC